MSNNSGVNNKNCGNLTSKHAVVFPEVSGVSDLFEYVKAIGAIIGVKQIHSVICLNGMVKVYLKEIKYVQDVANSGFHIGGQRTPVELADESATKVTLCNVDSVIPDYSLENILRPYGDLVSKVVGVKFNNDVYSSHVEFGEKQVYMNLYPGTCVPNVLDVVHENKHYEIITHVKSSSITSPFHSKPAIVPLIAPIAQPNMNEMPNHPINHSSVTAESDLNVENELSASPSYTEQIQADFSSNEINEALHSLKKKHKHRRGKKSKRLGLQSEKSKYMKKGVQFKDVFRLQGSSKTSTEHYTRGSVAKDEIITEEEPNSVEDHNYFKIVNAVSVLSSENGSSDAIEEGVNIITVEETNNTKSYLLDEEKERFSALSIGPLTLEQLEEYLRIVKNNRMPEKMAVNFFVENNIHDASLSDLVLQLNIYSSVCSFPNMKNRISRIVSQIKELL